MQLLTNSPCGWLLTPGLLAVALLAWTSPALAQGSNNSGGFGGTSSGGSGGMSSGGFGGSSSGGFGGSSSGGFGGQSSGSSFGGGSAGGGSFGSSFSGSSGGSFSGGNAFGSGGGPTTGSSFRTTTGAGAAATGVTTYSVSTSNLLGTYYGNPTAMGTPGITGRTTFGQPVYNLSTTPGMTGSFGTGLQGGAYSQSSSFSPSGGHMPVTYYVATLGFPHGQQITSGKVLGEVRQVVARSSSLPSKDKIRVLMAGDTVILQGSVSDEHERRLAAALVSMTPGVHGVSNELKVQGRPFMPTLP